MVTFIACEIVTGGRLTEILGTHRGRFLPAGVAGVAAASLAWPCCSAAIAGTVPTVRIAIQRSHGLLSDTAQLFDALDARSNFEPIMQSMRDLNKLDDA